MEKEALCQMIFDQITKYLAPNHPTIMKTPMEMKHHPPSKSNKRVVLNILSTDSNLEDGPVDVLFGAKGFRPDEKPDIHGMCDSTSMQSDRDYDALGDPSDETLKPDSAEEEQPEIGDLCENTASHVLPSSEIQDDRRNSGGKRNPYALSMHDLSPGMLVLGIREKLFHTESQLQEKKGSFERHNLPQGGRENIMRVILVFCSTFKKRYQQN